MRKVIARKQSTSEASFKMSDLIQYLEDYLTTEEMCTLYAGERTTKQLSLPRYASNMRTTNLDCMYCRGEHSPSSCTTLTTPQARSQYLRQNQLCLLCASPAHKTQQCRRRPCFYCKAAHHSSCCFSRRADAVPNKQEHPPAAKNPIEEAKKENKSATSVNNNQVANEQVADQDSVLQLQAVLYAQETKKSILPTGEATVLDPKTKALRKVDVLFDSGAELSFIDISLAEELCLPVIREEEMKLHTFGTKDIREARCKLVKLDIWDAEGRIHTFHLHTNNILTQALSVPRISDTDREAISAMKMSVQYLNTEKKVIKPLILLGCDQLWGLIRTDSPPISLASGLMLLPTKLGYIMSGQSRVTTEEENHRVLQVAPCPQEAEKWNSYWSMDVQVNTVHSSDSHISETEQEMWENYWTMDAAGTEPFMGPSKEAREALDKTVWEQFNKTIEKRQDGYYVRLPWKEQCQYLPDNYAIAYKRLINVWASLKKDETLLEQYNNVFQEQLQKNIVEVVDSNKTAAGHQVHYIPHQPVFTPQKTTTKLRIVFDASAHYKGSPSLNDVLHRGPVILPSIYGLLLRFRVGAIALTSDVERAFLQIRLHEADRDVTRCLWLRDHKKPPERDNIITLRFTRVTFGIKSSPFLLAGTTRYHLDSYLDDPLSQEIKDNIYVDNLILTSDTYQEALQFYKKSKKIFEELGMNLREFVSNSSKVLEAIDKVDKADAHSMKVLGIHWEPQSDTFELSCCLSETSPITKRAITSAIAKVYDPLGWLVPLLHHSRVFLQQLWKDQYGWDTSVSTDRANEWKQIQSHTHGFRKTLKRFVTYKASEAMLITFADASTSGITACTYLFQAQSRSAHLLMARSKLPSLQEKTTIPKLELNAMTLAVRLSNAVLSQLEKVLNVRTLYVFSDSEIVLNWIRNKPQREVGIFVHNRLIEIRRITEHLSEKGCCIKFGYVATEDNPADCGTRGLTSNELSNHFWWTGPWFLQKHPQDWPARDKIFVAPQDDTAEIAVIPMEETPRQTLATTTLSISANSFDEVEIIERGHAITLTQAKRILAHALRFLTAIVSRIRKKRGNNVTISILQDSTVSRETQYLSGKELEWAGQILIKHHQRFKVSNNIVKSLKHLNIRPDAEGILRCYGRLGRAQIDIRAKYPIIILQKTLLAELIIRDVHNRSHQGINHTMAMVRQNFWIPQLRSQVTRIVRKCILCQKFNNLPYQYPAQEDLPKERVIRSSPFSHIGLDYFGPLTVSLANDTQAKCFGSIITCMVTRLVHLDVVTDLSTAAFLQMLRRFFARRGVPKLIISDNAPTFLLGESIIRDAIQAPFSDPTIAKNLSNRGIEWKHITPFAPWQGGFYERLIKSIKHSLYKTLRGPVVTFEELSTVMTEIEAIINTRPLTYLGNDTDSLEALRPIDFLQKDIDIKFPLLDITDDQSDIDYVPHAEIPSLITKKQAITALQSSCKLTEKFWEMWHTQYLTSLREKHTLSIGAKRGCVQSPREGDLVLVSDPVVPRQAWKVGMIDNLVMNSNGTIREALVRLPTRRVIRRPINLLVPLELEESPYPRKNEHQSDAGILEGKRREDEAQKDTCPSHRYNLRRREKVNYNEDDIKTMHNKQH